MGSGCVLQLFLTTLLLASFMCSMQAITCLVFRNQEEISEGEAAVANLGKRAPEAPDKSAPFDCACHFLAAWIAPVTCDPTRL